MASGDLIKTIENKPEQVDISSYITGDSGWATTKAIAVYSTTTDGKHYLQFNIAGTTSSSVSTEVIEISGVTFKNVTGFYQAITASGGGGAPVRCSAYVTPNDDRIDIKCSTSITNFQVSGEVELDSKPTWA